MDVNNGPSEDDELIRRFLKDRSESNFQKIYRKFGDGIYRVALHLTHYDEGKAMDLCQETWITTIQKLSMFERRSTLRTWITGILVNKCRDEFKTAVRNRHLEVVEDMAVGLELNSTTIRMDLESAIGQLSPGYREVLVLHDAEGYKHHEIATLLGITEGTSKSQLFHARGQVRKYLMDIP